MIQENRELKKELHEAEETIDELKAQLEQFHAEI